MLVFSLVLAAAVSLDSCESMVNRSRWKLYRPSKNAAIEYRLVDRPGFVNVHWNAWFLEQTEQRLGVRVARPITYIRVPSMEAVYCNSLLMSRSQSVGVWGSGIAYPEYGLIFSTLEYHPHEIVHVVARSLGRPGSFWDEGLAVALSGERFDESYARERVRAAGGIGYTITNFKHFGLGRYDIAGAFVAHLIAKYQLPKFVEFFGRCVSPDAVPNAFHDTFGKTLEEAAEVWLAS